MSFCRDIVVTVKLILNTQHKKNHSKIIVLTKTTPNKQKYRTILFELRIRFPAEFVTQD